MSDSFTSESSYSSLNSSSSSLLSSQSESSSSSSSSMESSTSLSSQSSISASSASSNSSSSSSTSLAQNSSSSSSTSSNSSSNSSSSSSSSNSSSSSSSVGDSGMAYEYVIKMLTSDQTIAINGTTNVQSVHAAYGSRQKYIDVRKFDKGRIYLYVKGGNASCSKAITFYFQVSPDCEHWFDIEPIAVTMSGTSVITSATSHSAVDLSTVGFFRLQRVANAETETGYTATVNAGLWLPL